MEPKTKAVAEDTDWTTQDAERLTALTDRYSTALITIYQKLKY
jgi:hypothetical protein